MRDYPQYASREKDIVKEYDVLLHLSPVMTSRYYIAREYVKKGLDDSITENDIHKLTAAQHGAIRPAEPDFTTTLPMYQQGLTPFLMEAAKLYGEGPITLDQQLHAAKHFKPETKQIMFSLGQQIDTNDAVALEASNLVRDTVVNNAINKMAQKSRV